MKKRVLKNQSERKGVSDQINDKYVKKLSYMIECKTVWTKTGENDGEFKKFYSVLSELFPNVCARAKRHVFGGGCFFFVIEGKNATKNLLIMSHHDVVDGGEGWNTDPFTATVSGDYLYGRGAIDTKTPLFAELQAAEELLAEGFSFEGVNLYIGSSNNEEVGGDGMVIAAEYFKENGIRFDLVLDEGGAVTEGQIPGVKCKSAMVAVHEKGRHVYRCKTHIKSSGHGGFGGASDSAVERLSRFITEVTQNKSKIFKPKFYPEVEQTFVRHAPYMPFLLKTLFGHMRLFAPVIKRVMAKIPAANAMLSTSVTFTALSAGDLNDAQVRAKCAETSMLLRCVREDELYSGLEKIKKTALKYGVELEEIERDYCKPTDYESRAFKLVEDVLHENFPDVVVAPFLLTAGTDARRLTDVADSILRFAPIDLSKAQFATVHAANENIGIKNVGECVLFYKTLIERF